MSVLILSVIAAIIIALFQIMYNSARQNLLNVWENNVIQLARSTEYYLARPMDAIEMSSSNVERMIAEGKSNDEIKDYLINEKDAYASIVENNYTGVYGFCRGEFMDASGWVPPEDYDPDKRPWYTEAKAGGGKISLVSPFLNMQTNEMMMSVSKLLKDGESVLSIDIFMDGLRNNLYELVLQKGVKSAFIVDEKGNVVVHSSKDETGLNYLEDGDGYHKNLVRQAFKIADREGYSDNGMVSDEIIFADRINGGWCAVLVLNESSQLRSIQHVNTFLVLFLALAIMTWFLISYRVNRKYREAARLSSEVNAVADIYEAMILVDLKTDRMTVLRSNDYLEGLLGGELGDFSKRIGDMMSKLASAGSCDMLAQFMDPSTYDGRMKDVRSLSHDCKDAQGRWIRVQLIVVDRDSKGNISHLIWAIESIDEERKQQERLKVLAETDALSRLRNRRSGETAIREMINEGTQGLFMLMDVDDFKGVNDNYGHDVGDLVIVAVADALRNIFRESDIVFRLGGDEYAVFAPGVTDDRSKAALISRLRAEISRISIPELKGRIISSSVGTAYCFADADDSFEELYQQADQEMYEEKKRKKAERT